MALIIREFRYFNKGDWLEFEWLNSLTLIVYLSLKNLNELNEKKQVIVNPISALSSSAEYTNWRLLRKPRE